MLYSSTLLCVFHKIYVKLVCCFCFCGYQGPCFVTRVMGVMVLRELQGALVGMVKNQSTNGCKQWIRIVSWNIMVVNNEKVHALSLEMTNDGDKRSLQKHTKPHLLCEVFGFKMCMFLRIYLATIWGIMTSPPSTIVVSGDNSCDPSCVVSPYRHVGML